MNVLAGSLYGSATAVPMIALLSTAGSSGSYWLSRLVVKVGRPLAPHTTSLPGPLQLGPLQLP